jgi:hypothetical protein
VVPVVAGARGQHGAAEDQHEGSQHRRGEPLPENPAHRVTVSLLLPPVSHASTATMIGTEAISRTLRELG